MTQVTDKEGVCYFKIDNSEGQMSFKMNKKT